MMGAFLYLLYSAFFLLAQGATEVPQKSLADLLLVQHPTGVASRQGNTGVTRRARKAAVPAMQASFDVKTMPGVTDPVGFWDPLGFSKDADEKKMRFLRFIELKNGRLAMLATLGMIVAEQFHPFLEPATVPMTAMQLNNFALYFIMRLLAILEGVAFYLYFGPENKKYNADEVPGAFPGPEGWDPLNLKPNDPEKFKTLQNQEINNGRLAMLAAAGILAQEGVTGVPTFR